MNEISSSSDFPTPALAYVINFSELTVSDAKCIIYIYQTNECARFFCMEANLLEDFSLCIRHIPSFMEAAAADSAAKKCGGNVVSN